MRIAMHVIFLLEVLGWHKTVCVTAFSPQKGQVFTATLAVMSAEWNTGTRSMRTERTGYGKESELREVEK